MSSKDLSPDLPPVAAEPITATTIGDTEIPKQIALDDIPNHDIQSPETNSPFEKGVKNVVGFFAKTLGKADPETGKTTAQLEAEQSEKSSSNFFGKLVNGTKNLLSHAETFTETAYQKTKEISQKVIKMPAQIANTAADTVQKGVALGTQMSEKIIEKGQQIGEKLENTGVKVKDGLHKGVDVTLSGAEKLGSGVSDGAKKILKDPLTGVKDIASTVGSTAKDLGTEAVQGVKDLGTEAVQGIKEVGTQVKEEVQSLSNDNGDSDTGILGSLKSGLQKGKEIGEKVAEKGKSLIENPIENIDKLLDKDANQAPILDPDDPNKQDLEQIGEQIEQ